MNKRGSALLIVVIIMSMVFFMAIIMVDISIRTGKIFKPDYNNMQSYYCAESGINDVTNIINSIYNNNGNSSITLNKGDTISHSSLFNDDNASYQVLIQNIVDNSSKGSGSGSNNSNGNGNGNAYGNNKPYFTTDAAKRVNVPEQISKIYVDDKSNVIGLPSSVEKEYVKFLKKAIDDHISVINNSINDEIDIYRNSAVIYNSSNIDNIIQYINSINNSSVVIMSNNWINLNKNIVVGSPSKSVTMILNGLNINSGCQSIALYGNLIVLNGINENTGTRFDIYRVNNQGGDMYLKGSSNLNYTSTINIQNTLYVEDNFNVNQTASINADRLVAGGRLSLNGTTQLAINNDIILGALTCNASASITSVNGDLIVDGDFNKNGILNVNAGGRVCIGGKIVFNNGYPAITTGGKTTSLILNTDNQGGGGSEDGQGITYTLVSTGIYADRQYIITSDITVIQNNGSDNGNNGNGNKYGIIKKHKGAKKK